MLFMFIGLVMLMLKYLQIGSVADLSWYTVLSPFAMSIVWWWWSDTFGRTKRLEMEKMEMRRQKRIEKQREHLGMLSAKRKKK